MRRIVEAAAGVWVFIAGDDWVTAVGVVAALGLTGLISGTSAGWFVMPMAVGFLLALSILRESRKRRHG